MTFTEKCNGLGMLFVLTMKLPSPFTCRTSYGCCFSSPFTMGVVQATGAARCSGMRKFSSASPLFLSLLLPPLPLLSRLPFIPFLSLLSLSVWSKGPTKCRNALTTITAKQQLMCVPTACLSRHWDDSPLGLWSVLENRPSPSIFIPLTYNYLSLKITQQGTTQYLIMDLHNATYCVTQ